MQNNNENRAMEIANKFANHMEMAGWTPQDSFIEALTCEIVTAMGLGENGDIEASTDLPAALQHAAQRLKI